jgi:hypothetical protein
MTLPPSINFLCDKKKNKMKIVIIGAGSGGVWTALHYGYHTRNIKNIEVELIHDPEIDSFPVGQGTTIGVAELLWAACGTDWYHNEIRATPKLGILYENFSKKNKNIFHPFNFSAIAIQVDPKYLQKYILNSGLFAVKEGNVTDLDTVDADVIFDCRGNTKKDDIEYESLYCPVNSVLLSLGPSPPKTQLWTRHVATPDGWTFVIPNTTDSTSYGYLYNKDITSLETAKINFSELFPEASESYSGHFEHREEVVNLPFESYMAKTPIRIDSNGRKIILSGNRLGFIEPMETTAIGFYLDVAVFTFDWIIDETSMWKTSEVSHLINKMNREIHTFILWHYIRGSIYDTPFWKAAQTETTAIFEQPNENFQNVVNLAKSMDYMNCRNLIPTTPAHIECGYGQWGPRSIKQWYDKYIK